MEILSQLSALEGKDAVFKLGEEGRELNGKITRIHEKHKAFTVEYYDPELEAGAGVLVSFANVARIEDNLVVFKK
jgi:ribosomal protein L35AE/L33A